MARQTLPGFIDVHVHLRDPGGIHKEDFRTGTQAAVAGGITAVLDMPNNAVPTLTRDRLEEKKKLAGAKALCFVGFHFGTDGTNLAEFPLVMDDPGVYGLKVYADHTTGSLLLEDPAIIEYVFGAWKSEKPIMLHAEGVKVSSLIALADRYERRIHLCHIARTVEVEAIRKAKAKGMRVSCGVTPHHLFLTQADTFKLGTYGYMKPEIGSDEDRQALWNGLADGTIDLVETDHAPHTKAEKESVSPPFGVPGLETSLSLMLSAVHDGKISLKDVVRLMHETPVKIFHLELPQSTIELDPDEPYVIGSEGYVTRCGWSPFAGRTAYGQVKKVTIKGATIYDNGQFVRKEGI